MNKIQEYRQILLELDGWDAYLLKNCGLPGPRANLELAQAVADLGTSQLFERYREYDADSAPVNSPYEFLAFCGVLGLGRLLSESQTSLFSTLKSFANDSRWRIREAVAMALQQFGGSNMPDLINAMQSWSRGTLLERRAAAAALCEPHLLGRLEDTRAVLMVLDRITASLLNEPDRRAEEFRILRQGLGYCWSIAVVSDPEDGKTLMEKWLLNPNADIRWIMRENLKKTRLERMDAGWVDCWLNQTGKKK